MQGLKSGHIYLDCPSGPIRKDAYRLSKTDPAKKIQVTIVLRRRPDHAPLPKFSDYVNCPPRSRLSEEEFATKYGAHPDDFDELRSHYQQYGFDTIDTHAARRQIYLTGTIAQHSNAFGVEFHNYETHVRKLTVRYYTHHGVPQIPQHLSHIIIGLDGLHTEPLAIPPAEEPPIIGGLSYSTVASIYNFPSNRSGAGQVIGIPIFSGWGLYAASDLQSTCSANGILVPSVTTIDLSNGGISPGTDAENTLDVTFCAIFAPGCAIVNYISQSVLTFITRVVHPNAGDQVCTIASMSVGVDEVGYGASALAALETVFEDAAIQTVTCFGASGDWGVTAGVPSTSTTVLHPAVSQFVTGVGGTVIGANSGTVSSTNFVEWVWNENAYYNVTGGGVSVYIAQPSYQNGFSIPTSMASSTGPISGSPGRGVPDIAANADVDSAPKIFYTGVQIAGGGTSASTPMMAAAIACINHALGRNVGFINPTLYTVGNTSSIIRRLNAGGQTDNAFLNASVSPSFQEPGYPVNLNGWSANVGLGMLNISNFMTYITSSETNSILSISLSNTTVNTGSASGTVVGAISVLITPGTFSGTLSVGGTNASSFQIIGSNLCTLGVIASGNYSVTITATEASLSNSPFTSSPQAITAAALTPTILGVTLTPVPGGGSIYCNGSPPSGTTLAALSVTVANEASFIGGLSLSGAPTGIAITGNNLVTTSGAIPVGSYNFNIIATQSGATGSPFSKFVSLIVATAQPVTIQSVTLSSQSFAPGAAVGTIIATINVNVNSGFFFAGAVTLGGTNASLFAISNVNFPQQLVTASSSIPAGNYSITLTAIETGVTGSPFTSPPIVVTAGTVATAITGITLSTNSVTAGSASGTTVGTISVQTTGAAFGGTLSLSGTNASTFQLSGNNLLTAGTITAGTNYSINIIATQSGVTGSPFTQAETISGASTGTITITGITLSSTNFAANSPSGTIIGAIGVQVTG